MSEAFRWSSPEGHALAHRILRESPLEYDPHDYQIEGVCASLDGIDLLAITPTGSGKTGFYTMYMLIILAVLKDPNLCPTASFPADPCLIVICPTIPLQLEMASKMTAVGLSALAINSTTCAEALTMRDEDLWLTARKGVNVVVAGPEQLKSDKFELALRDDMFFNRCCGVGFDEVHLLNVWGPRFRQDFLQMGFVKARMTEKHNPWILTTTTLRDGAPYDNVVELLGLTPGRFHIIRRSNARPDIQIIFRELSPLSVQTL
ncbi:P-loop containing nucleoside triphosphate hydrolase protein [Mycena galericulata]|nr:P-loop containing nucleoside triphosphate hydrolase protein [Mycena galericulata]